jgi:imidazolonepropionase-like amidohydrolase
MLLTKSQAYRALEGAANARKTLLAGFTTVRDVENEGSGYADVDLRNAIRRGLVPGPRMKVATRGIAAVGQYYPFGVSSDLPDFPRGAQMVSGVDEVRRAVREQIGNGADLIKVYADWDYPTLTIDELRTVVEEAHKASRKVAAHATTTEGIRNAVTAGVDSIEHGDKADRATLLEMKAKHVWLVPTYSRELAVVDEVPEDARAEVRAYLEKKGESLRLAHELGVNVAVGSDAGETKYHGANAAELRALVSAGFTTAEAIRAATITAAELLGMPERIGTIEPGKAADVIAVRGDVLADVSVLQHVTFVMTDGEVIR